MCSVGWASGLSVQLLGITHVPVSHHTFWIRLTAWVILIYPWSESYHFAIIVGITWANMLKWSEVLVTQRCPTLFNPMDWGSPGSSVHGILQRRYWSGLPFPSLGDLPNPGIEPRSPALQADSWLCEPPAKLSVEIYWQALFFLLNSRLSLSEKAMAPHSSTLAWQIPWMEEPGGQQSMGSLRVGHNFTFTFSFHFHALEKEMATHSSVLAWRIPGTGEPGGLLSLGSHRVGQTEVT